MPFDPLVTLAHTAPREPQRSVPVLSALVILCCATTAAAFGLIGSEAVLSTGFDRAFASLGVKVSATHRRYDGIAGTEEFWLSSVSDPNVVKAVSVGQILKLSSGGTERQMTITGVEDAAEAVTHIETGEASARVWLITCREGDAASGREIRLRLESGTIREIPSRILPRAL